MAACCSGMLTQGRYRYWFGPDCCGEGGYGWRSLPLALWPGDFGISNRCGHRGVRSGAVWLRDGAAGDAAGSGAGQHPGGAAGHRQPDRLHAVSSVRRGSGLPFRPADGDHGGGHAGGWVDDHDRPGTRLRPGSLVAVGHRGGQRGELCAGHGAAGRLVRHPAPGSGFRACGLRLISGSDRLGPDGTPGTGSLSRAGLALVLAGVWHRLSGNCPAGCTGPAQYPSISGPAAPGGRA